MDDARSLRSLSGGFLLRTDKSQRKELLPPKFNSSRACASKSVSRPCFESASVWTNLLPTNAAFHTLWLRQHNTVARELHILNRHWDDERLYQEARRIIIAQIQHITYSEFLPILLGKEQVSIKGLRLRKRSFDSGYDMKNVNPSALNEFASSVGLFFFALLPDTIAEVSEQGLRARTKHLSNFFNDPSMVYLQDKVESLLRYLTQTPMLRGGFVFHLLPKNLNPHLTPPPKLF